MITGALDAAMKLGLDTAPGRRLPCEALILPDGRCFPAVYLNPRGETLIGINQPAGEAIKIRLTSNSRRLNSPRTEYDILVDLAGKRCATSPRPFDTGQLDANLLSGPLREANVACGDHVDFLIEEYVPSAADAHLADLLLAVAEQKALGYYHADLKPSNIRFDVHRGVCVLIDYDQAQPIDDSIKAMDLAAFLEWCDAVERRRYGAPSWLRHFPSVSRGDVHALLRNGALNLAATTLYKRQVTTNTETGIYHAVRTRDLFADGSRDLDDRRAVLDAIDFQPGEHVLDVGCNAGLLSHYLADRGCSVTGIDMDPFMMTAAGMIARSTDRPIQFLHADVDAQFPRGSWQTIMLFSVLHHCDRPHDVARRVAAACNRVIVETRLIERGKKPREGAWRSTGEWRFADIGSLVRHLESLFEGFVLHANHGLGGKDRFVLELRRRCA